MKILILCFLAIALAAALQLNIDSKLNLSNSYQLSCSEAQGPVTYQVQNLPNGVVLVGDRIVVQAAISFGYFPIKISARDSTGRTDERIVVIFITNSTQSQGQSINVPVQTNISSSSEAEASNLQSV